MKVPDGYRNYSPDERIKFVQNLTIGEWVDIVRETMESEVVGRHINTYDPPSRLEDIRVFLDNYIAFHDIAEQENNKDFWVWDSDFPFIVTCYAQVAFLQGNWRLAEDLINNRLSKRKNISDYNNDVINDLQRKIADEKSLKTRYVRTAEKMHGDFIQPQQSGCFIATAAYGTPYANEINIIRYWRDNKLCHSTLGKFFIKVYYRISPTVADYISKSEFKKLITRKILKPLILILKKK